MLYGQTNKGVGCTAKMTPMEFNDDLEFIGVAVRLVNVHRPRLTHTHIAQQH